MRIDTKPQSIDGEKHLKIPLIIFMENFRFVILSDIEDFIADYISRAFWLDFSGFDKKQPFTQGKSRMWDVLKSSKKGLGYLPILGKSYKE